MLEQERVTHREIKALYIPRYRRFSTPKGSCDRKVHIKVCILTLNSI